MVTSAPEPDQEPSLWDDHVSLYEKVFEPFSSTFADLAIDRLRVWPGMNVLDVGAGSGGAAMALAHRGCKVTAIDASERMIARIEARTAGSGIVAEVMDGQALRFAGGQFDAALSVFGVILFPDAVRGLAEMRRVVRPGGSVAVVTWTEPQHYELSAQLRAAIEAVRPGGKPGALPAQWRFRERDACAALFHSAGFADVTIDAHGATLRAPSARWLAERLAFAPGMAAQLAALGSERSAVLDRFVSAVENKQGRGEVCFAGRAFVACGSVT